MPSSDISNTRKFFMHSMITVSALSQCLTSLEEISQDYSHELTRNAWKRCCQGIKIIMNNLDSYIKNIITAERFFNDFAANIDDMLFCLKRLQEEKELNYAYRLEDLVFALNEEMAVLMREHCLRTGAMDPNEDEIKFLDFFEMSKNWFLGDGTLISEFYYVTLPTRVISDLVHKVEKKICLPPNC